MPKLFYGSFESILRKHITPNITQEELVNILLIAPIIDRKMGQEAKDAVRSIYHFDKGNLSKFCKGTRQIPLKTINDHLVANALENIEHCFLTEIIPRISIIGRTEMKEEIVSLICQDDGISEDERLYYKEAAAKKELCTFLAETHIFAVTGISAPMKAVTKPKNTNLPPQNRFFCGRKKILDTIRQQYREGAHLQGVYGMGGVGKTQIALQYAYSCFDEYKTVWWMNAENALTLQNGAVSFLRLQGYPVEDKCMNDIRFAFVDYFNRHSNWLLVYDNAEYGTADEYETLFSYLPGNISQGDILLTTRCKNAFEDAVHREIPVFAGEEAVSFLQNRSGINDSLNAKKLAEQMGYLPLALEYAAAYIRETPGVDYAAYGRKLGQYGIRVLDRRIGHQAYKRTVREAFHITLDKMLEDSASNPVSKSAEQFLNICAFLAPEGIVLRIFSRFGGGLPEPVRSVLADELECDELVRVLTRYSLVRAEWDVISLHQLLQEVLYDEIEPDNAMLCVNYAYGVFYHVFYSMRKMPVNESRPLLALFVPHVQAIMCRYIRLYRHNGRIVPDSIMVAKEYFSWTSLLLENGKRLSQSELIENCQREIPVLETAVTFYHMLQEYKTIYLAYTVMLLAQSYAVIGNLEAAVEQYSQAITITDEVLGELPARIDRKEANTVGALYRTEAFQLASDICAAIASSNCIYTQPQLLWKNYHILTKMLLKQFACFPHKGEEQEYRETWLKLWVYSQQISDYTQRAFIIHLDAPGEWMAERKNSFLSGTFGFFCPAAETNPSPSDEVLEGFDILLDNSESAIRLKDNWVTLAFMRSVRTLNDVLNVLLSLEINNAVNTKAERLLDSAVYALAVRLEREDTMLLYREKL